MRFVHRLRSSYKANAMKVASGAVVAALLLLAGHPLVAQAQASRTWVSGVGDDANPCSRTAPCKTFAGAISKTAAGGEIDALDPGGFGTVTITKAITIDGTPFQAGVLAAGVNGIVVTAGTSDIVVLRGLSIQGQGTGLDGIKVTSVGSLFVEDSVVDGFRGSPGHGIDFEPSAGAELYVTNTVIRNNSASGIFAKSPGGISSISVDGTRFDNNAIGVNAQDNTRVTVRDGVVTNNTTAGVAAQAAAGTAEVNLESVVASLNGLGLSAGGSGVTGTIRMTNVTVVNNTVGIFAGAGGTVLSFVNNRIAGNGTDGAPTTTKAQQ